MVNRPQRGGATADKYFLTIECFKMMGMQVSGEQVGKTDKAKPSRFFKQKCIRSLFPDMANKLGVIG